MESANSPLLDSLLLGDTNPSFIDEHFDANLLTPSAFVDYWCDEVENGVPEGGKKCDVNDDDDEKNKVVSGGVVVDVKNASSAGENKINIISDVTIRAGYQPKDDDDGDKKTSMLRKVLTMHPSIARNKNTFYNMLRSGENEIEVEMSGEPVKRRRKCAPTPSGHEEWTPTPKVTIIEGSPTPPPPSVTSEMSPVSSSLMMPPPPLPPLESPSDVMCGSPKSDWLNAFSASQKDALLGVLVVHQSIEKDVRESEDEVNSMKKQLDNLKNN